MQPRHISAFMLALALAAVPLPAQRPAPAPAKSAANATRVQPKLSDTQLEALIREKFAKSKSANTFRVRVQGGTATIEGKTDVIQHKAAATRMARTAGATLVNNKVEISEAAKEKAAGNLTEGRRRVQVKRGDPRSDR